MSGGKICSSRNQPYLEVGELEFDIDSLLTDKSLNSLKVSVVVVKVQQSLLEIWGKF